MTPCLVEDQKWKNIAAADTGSTCAESNDIVGRKGDDILQAEDLNWAQRYHLPIAVSRRRMDVLYELSTTKTSC